MSTNPLIQGATAPRAAGTIPMTGMMTGGVNQNSLLMSLAGTPTTAARPATGTMMASGMQMGAGANANLLAALSGGMAARPAGTQALTATTPVTAATGAQAGATGLLGAAMSTGTTIPGPLGAGTMQAAATGGIPATIPASGITIGGLTPSAVGAAAAPATGNPTTGTIAATGGASTPPITTFFGLDPRFLGSPAASSSLINPLLYGSSFQEVPINFGAFNAGVPPVFGGQGFSGFTGTPFNFFGQSSLISPFSGGGSGFGTTNIGTMPFTGTVNAPQNFQAGTTTLSFPSPTIVNGTAIQTALPIITNGSTTTTTTTQGLTRPAGTGIPVANVAPNGALSAIPGAQTGVAGLQALRSPVATTAGQPIGGTNNLLASLGLGGGTSPTGGMAAPGAAGQPAGGTSSLLASLGLGGGATPGASTRVALPGGGAPGVSATGQSPNTSSLFASLGLGGGTGTPSAPGGSPLAGTLGAPVSSTAGTAGLLGSLGLSGAPGANTSLVARPAAPTAPLGGGVIQGGTSPQANASSLLASLGLGGGATGGLSTAGRVAATPQAPSTGAQVLNTALGVLGNGFSDAASLTQQGGGFGGGGIFGDVSLDTGSNGGFTLPAGGLQVGASFDIQQQPTAAPIATVGGNSSLGSLINMGTNFLSI